MKGQYPELWVIIYQSFFKEYNNKDPGSSRTYVIRMVHFGDGGREDGEGVDGSQQEGTEGKKRGETVVSM